MYFIEYKEGCFVDGHRIEMYFVRGRIEFKMRGSESLFIVGDDHKISFIEAVKLMVAGDEHDQK